MAFSFTVNQTPTTGSDVFFQWKTLLKSLGSPWTVPSSSDGTTYNAAGDQISSGGAGANGMANNRAWYRVKTPTLTHEICVQRSTASNAQWRIKLSPAAGFVGGSPSATQVPSATDEVVLAGGGTDAAPTFTTILAVDGTYRCQLGADGAAPYGNFWATYPSGGGNPNGGWLMDPLSPVDASDPDPYIYYISFNSSSAYRGGGNGFDLSSEAATSSMKGYLGAVATAANLVTVPGIPGYSMPGGVVVWPSGVPVSPFSTKDIEQFVQYSRRSALTVPNGWKGVSTLIKWHTPGRSTGDTVNTKARIIIGEVSLPWDGTTTPIL